MSDNLALWNGFCNTDPAFTKTFNRAGFQGTAINPVYISRRLTEQFGPVGIGWRFVIENETYREGHALDERGISRAVVHVVRGHLEYRIPPAVVIAPNGDTAVLKRAGDGEWIATGPQFGQTTFVGSNRNGLFTDEEAPKKSVTDCLGKCALQLGIGADISMGLWDDNKYASDPANSTAPKPRTPRKQSEPETATASPGVDLTNIETAVSTAAGPQELLNVFNDLRASVAIYNDLRTWEIVCGKIAKRFTAINQPQDPSSIVIIGQLQSERIRLDAATPGVGNAQPVQQSGGTVPATRTRKAAVPT